MFLNGIVKLFEFKTITRCHLKAKCTGQFKKLQRAKRFDVTVNVLCKNKDSFSINDKNRIVFRKHR